MAKKRRQPGNSRLWYGEKQGGGERRRKLKKQTGRRKKNSIRSRFFFLKEQTYRLCRKSEEKISERRSTAILRYCTGRIRKIVSETDRKTAKRLQVVDKKVQTERCSVTQLQCAWFAWSCQMLLCGQKFIKGFLGVTSRNIQTTFFFFQRECLSKRAGMFNKNDYWKTKNSVVDFPSSSKILRRIFCFFFEQWSKQKN